MTMVARLTRRTLLQLAASTTLLGCASHTSHTARRRTAVALTDQELVDRIEIQDLLTRYCYAVDDRDWDVYRRVFTPDAVIDDTVTGGVRGGVEDHIVYMKRALSKVVLSQHAISTILFDVRGDEARTRTHCSCPMVVETATDKRHVFFQGLWYRHHFVRTPDGWKVKELVESGYWTHNLPQGFQF
jgi:hypothetical protein